MTSQTGPWSSQANDPAGPAPGPDWVRPGPVGSVPPPPLYGPVPPPPVYGPVPTHYSVPTAGYPAPPAYGPLPSQPVAPGYGEPHPGYAVPLRTDYASWGKRVGAMLIDFIPTSIGLVIFYVGYFVWLFQFSTTAGTGTPGLAGGLVPMIVGFAIMLAGFGWTIYNRWLVGGRTGQSLGKRVTKIRLVSELTDAPIGPMNAFLRDLVHILDGMAYVGYLWPLWDDRKQTFADKIVRTVVVIAR
jgi:uncharacterized RDD family membrane protein YckC